MSRKETRHVGTFSAVAKDGTEFEISEFQTFIECKTFDGTEWVAGMKQLRTSDGESVNRIEKGKYEVLQVFGLIAVTSDDPNAF